MYGDTAAVMQNKAPKVTGATSFCESLTLEPGNSFVCSNSVTHYGLNLASVNVEHLCFIPNILGHTGTDLRFVITLFLEYLLNVIDCIGSEGLV